MNKILTTLDASSLRAYYEAGHWTANTVYSLVRSFADKQPAKIAIREQSRSTSYAALVSSADRLAAALRDAGVSPGQRVALWLPNRTEFAVALLACSRDGYVLCPSLHGSHAMSEVAALVDRMGAAALITERGWGAHDADPKPSFADAGLSSLRLLIELEPGEDIAANENLTGANGEFSPISPDPDTVVYLSFTSGTTGQPKGVMHTDNTLMAPTRSLQRDWSLSNRSIVYSLSPLSHNLGFGAMITALTAGGEMVVHDLRREQSPADRMSATGTTFVYGVPTHALDLLAELADRPEAAPTTIQGFRISGAAMPPNVVHGLLSHGVVPQSGYGMTEVGSNHYTLPHDDPTLISESSGRPSAGSESGVFDPENPNSQLPNGEVGIIGMRGPSVMVGYFDDQRQTEMAFNAAGWFLTGDLGWFDEAGYVRVTGRQKDLIIRGGRNIAPAKIERLAMRHSAVRIAAAVPISDERLGEKVCLVVERAADRDVQAEDLLRFLHESGLSKHDMPEYFAVLDGIPLTSSGKAWKQKLQEMLREDFEPIPVRYRSAK